MCHSNRMILSLVAAIVAMTMLAAQAYAQDNPYRIEEGWAKLLKVGSGGRPSGSI